jgi:AraC-like DNA-binding protein
MLEMWIMGVPAGLMPPEAMQLGPSDLVQSVDPVDLLELDRLLARIARTADDLTLYEAGLAYAVISLWRAGSSKSLEEVRSSNFVSRALALLSADPQLGLEDVGRKLGVSPSHLGRLIRTETDRGFIDWRNRIRLDRFIEYFQTGDNLAVAALNAGFGSYARFHAGFRAAFNITPGEWVARREIRGEVEPPQAVIMGEPPVNLRHRWVQLTTAAPATINQAFGQHFLDRLVMVNPSDSPLKADPFSGFLSQEQLFRLGRAMATKDPALAASFRELFANANFAEAGSEVMRRYQLNPENLIDTACAFLMMIWVCAADGGDPPLTGTLMARDQIACALADLPDRVEPAVIRDAHTSLFCHYTILMHCLFASRASGTPAAAADLSRIVVAQSEIWVGGDPTTLQLTDAGFSRV